MSLSPCRQLISCTAIPYEPTLDAVRILLPTSIQRQIKTVSGVRFVLLVLHRDTGARMLWASRGFLQTGIQLIKSKSNNFAPLADQRISYRVWKPNS